MAQGKKSKLAELSKGGEVLPPKSGGDQSQVKLESAKDYLEHIRQIHFALLATVAILFTFFIGLKNLKPAHAELREINSIVESWNPEMFHQAIANRDLSLATFAEFPLYCGTGKGSASRSSHLGDFDLLLLSQHPYLVLETFDFSPDTKREQFTNHLKVDAPRNLGELKRVWNHFESAIPIVFPTRLSDYAYSVSSNSNNPSVSKERILNRAEFIKRMWASKTEDPRIATIHNRQGAFHRIYPVNDPEVKDKSFGFEFVTRSGQGDHDVDTVTVDGSGMLTTNFSQHYTGWPTSIFIPCTVTTSAFTGLSYIANTSGRTYTNKFEVTFPELAKLNGKYDDFTFAKAERELSAEIGVDPSQAMDVLGVKVPAQFAAGCSPVIVALIQIYLILHLKALNETLHTIHRSEVPCALCYRGVFPMLFSHATSWLIPLGVVCYVTFYSDLAFWKKALLISIPSITSLFLFFDLVKLRNKICNAIGEVEGDWLMIHKELLPWLVRKLRISSKRSGRSV